jgi:glycosyltransferase involved in cell wall biosynthesis
MNDHLAADQPRIDVLVATHHGADFLDAQLRSLVEQTCPPARILVRDDASTDATPALLADWAARRPELIELIDCGGRRLGACGNFAALLDHADADYVMFCDQDDVWFADKIARTLAAMQEAERRAGPDRPLLVHTDLKVVDQSLRPLGDSYWKYQRLDVRRGTTLNRLLVENVVTGCASMFNRALARRAAPIPPEAVFHDWWIALVAAAFGRIERLDEPTILYRQHGRNQVGAVRWDLAHVARKTASLFDRSYLVQSMQASQRQARAFLERFGPELPVQQRRAVEAYAGLGECGYFGRRWRLARYGFYRGGWLRTLGLFARI